MQLEYLIPCDQVISDPNTNKTTIFGIFNEIRAINEAPFTYRVSLAVKLIKVRSTDKIILKVLDSSGQDVFISEEIDIGNGGEDVQIAADRLPILFKSFGRHSVSVYSAGKRIGFEVGLNVIAPTK